MPWANSRSSSTPLRVAAELLQQRVACGRVGTGQLAREAQVRAQRDQLLLSAVVEIALDPPPLGVRGRDDAGPRGPELLGLAPELVERGLQLRVEPDVAQGEADLPGELGENAVLARRRRARLRARAPRR